MAVKLEYSWDYTWISGIPINNIINNASNHLNLWKARQSLECTKRIPSQSETWKRLPTESTHRYSPAGLVLRGGRQKLFNHGVYFGSIFFPFLPSPKKYFLFICWQENAKHFASLRFQSPSHPQAVDLFKMFEFYILQNWTMILQCTVYSAHVSRFYGYTLNL